MPWIKARTELFTHPKVVRMASALRADRLRIVGGLLSVWGLFDQHSTDGILPGYSGETLDGLVGFPGLAAAMTDVGWLEMRGDALVVPRFEIHNGQSAKRRAQDAERKQSVRKLSAPKADEMRTRGEKDEIDKYPPTPRKRGARFDPLSIQLPDWLNTATWARWCNDCIERRVKFTAAGVEEQLKKFDEYRQQGFAPDAVVDHSIAGSYKNPVPPGRLLPVKQQSDTTWDASRSGIEAEGERLGVGRWDEGAHQLGKGEAFHSYTARVRLAKTAFQGAAA